VKATAQLVQRWRQATTKAIRSLLTMPERGSLVDPDDHELAHVRRILIEGFPKHFIFYRSEPGSGTVIILRMLHGDRDVLSLLKDDTED
jgi:plasmid stabilization system protein ParE